MVTALAVLLAACLVQGALGGVGWRVYLPETIEVLKGSCVTIPCSFDIPDRYESDLDETCEALWWDRRNDDHASNYPQGDLNGDMMKKNCTTTLDGITDHSKNYRFRVECDNGLKWTYENKHVYISVKDHPHRPTLTPSTLEVREGTVVSVACSAPAPCLSQPPTLTWTPSLGESQETLVENQDKTKVKRSEVNFTTSHLQNGLNISCTAVYRKVDGSTESSVNSLTAVITYSPKNTTVSVSPSGPVEEDTIVTLTCSSEANPAVRNYTWYRSDGGQEFVIGTGRVFTIQASKVTDPVFCKAENELGAGWSNNTQIDVHYPPKNTTVSVSPSGPVEEDTNVTLTCSSKANPAVRNYTWYRSDGGQEFVIGTGRVFTIQASKVTDPVFCKAENELGAGRSNNTQIDVRYTPKNTTVSVSPSGPVEEDTNVTLTCSSKANPAVRNYTWYRSDGGQEFVIGTGRVFSIQASKVTDPVFCKAENELGAGRSNNTQIDVQYPPKDTTVSVSPSGPVEEDTTVTLTCSSKANPAVRNYTWYRSDGGQEFVIGTGRVFTIQASKVTDPVFCKAENELGAGRSNNTQIDVQYTPKNTTVSVSPSGPVEEDTNVTLTCSSKANPAVRNYTWYRSDGGQEFVIGTGRVFTIQASKVTDPVFCKAQNELGAGRSILTQIDVQYPPQILPSSECIKTLDQLNCSCKTWGNPAPTLHWYMDGSPANNLDSFAVRYELKKDTSVGFIAVSQAQWRDQFTLLCNSSNSLGSAAQRFYFFFETQTGSQDSVIMPVLIAITVGLVLLVCALLFVIRTQHNLLKSHSSGNGSTVSMSQLLPNGEGSKLVKSKDEKIYVNTIELKEGDVTKPATATESKSPSMPSSNSSNAEGPRNTSAETSTESKDVIYSSVIWKSKDKQREEGDNENQKDCTEGRLSRGFINNAVEMGKLYDVEPRNVKEKTECEYAQVKFKEKRAEED